MLSRVDIQLLTRFEVGITGTRLPMNLSLSDDLALLFIELYCAYMILFLI